MKILILGAPTSKGQECFGNKNKISGGGWVENLIMNLKENKSLEIYDAFYTNAVKKCSIRKHEDINYVALPIYGKSFDYCNKKMISDLKKIYSVILPDVVHIIGTEREYDLKLFEIAGADKTLISITGIVSICEQHYFGGIDQKNFLLKSFRDIVKRGGPIKEKKKFKFYSESENKLLQSVKYVSGRTTLDYAHVKQLNENAEYVHCSEILNKNYYEGEWKYCNIQKNRIFLSQGSYPLKGLHIMLKALPIILKKYPNTVVYIAGVDMINNSIKGKLKRTTYANYIRKLIKRLNIPSDKIIFTGQLDSDEMYEQYMKANVFVLPSIIENSPNSLGEAMLLGVPCVASCVGGIQDMMRDKIDGFIYPFDESYMLAYYICTIFEDSNLAITLGKNAQEHAKKRFDINTIINTTVNTYKKIMEEN